MENDAKYVDFPPELGASTGATTDVAAHLVTPVIPPHPDFPRAKAPVAPVLSFGAFFDGGAPAVPSVLDNDNIRLVTSGRIAIALALREMKVGAGDTVLVPSFHCASMVEPVIWSGARPVFFRVRPDTSVDLDDIAAKIRPDTRVLMVTNYFGFPQNLAAIREFCDARGLAMLEDCAHCFLGEFQGKPVGSFGDYAIASSMKFFPIYEGGALVSSRHSLDGVALHSAGGGFEAKSALNAIEDSFEYRRLGLLNALMWLPLATKNFLWKSFKATKSTSVKSMVPSSSEGGFSFDPNWLTKRSSVFSRLMVKHVSRPRIGALRRKNYLRLAAALEGIPGCRPLFPILPERVFPWVFPVLADNPQPVFTTLKSQGVPIIRFAEYLWPGVDATVCANSVELSRRVISFSCHQELSEKELAWMITLITTAFRSEQSLA